MRHFLTGLCLLTTSMSYCSEEMELLISKEEIDAKLKTAGLQIDQDYQDKNLTVVSVLKGALCVTSDLLQNIHVPCKLECIRSSSYGYNGMKAGSLSIESLDAQEIEGRDILIVDDIFESGNTMLGIIEKIKEKNPKSIKTFILLVKDVPRKIDYRPDYVLFDIPDRFVIGYGLDYKELYRGLPGIFAFIDDKPPF